MVQAAFLTGPVVCEQQVRATQACLPAYMGWEDMALLKPATKADLLQVEEVLPQFSRQTSSSTSSGRFVRTFSGEADRSLSCTLLSSDMHLNQGFSLGYQSGPSQLDHSPCASWSLPAASGAGQGHSLVWASSPTGKPDSLWVLCPAHLQQGKKHPAPLSHMKL